MAFEVRCPKPLYHLRDEIFYSEKAIIAKQRVIRMLIVIVIIFFCCWTPNYMWWLLLTAQDSFKVI